MQCDLALFLKATSLRDKKRKIPTILEHPLKTVLILASFSAHQMNTEDCLICLIYFFTCLLLGF